MPFNSDPSSNQPHKDEPPLADELGIADLQTQYFVQEEESSRLPGVKHRLPKSQIHTCFSIRQASHLTNMPLPKRFPFASAKMAYYLMISDIYAELSEPTTMVRNSTAWVKRAGVPESIQISWFDQNEVAHTLYYQDKELTIAQAFRLRNATHDGEISTVPELSSDAPKE